MRSRARGPLRALAYALAGVASVCPIAPAFGQDAAELARRVDSAMAKRAVVAVRYAALQSRTAAPRVFPDTIVMLGGALRLLTTAEFRPIVQLAATEAESFIHARAGTAPPGLTPRVFSIWTDSVRRAEHGVIIALRQGDRELGGSNVIADAASLARVLETDLQARLGTDAKPAFATWLGAPLPLDAATKWQWRAIRIELVSSRSTIARRCYDGDLGACKATLGFTVTADPATAWYDSASRHAIVAEAREAARLDARASGDCLSGSDSTCIALLRHSGQLAKWLGAPGSGEARMALVQEAFDAGGPGALARLAASQDAPLTAVSAIGNAPSDSLVRRWQQRARNGGVESESATPVVALTAAAWILMMGGVSLGSSRWR